MSTRLINAIFSTTLCVILVGGLAACDSGSDGGDGSVSLAIAGKVTDDPGFAKTAAEIEGAVVSASEVQTNGSLTALGGSATTAASGRYTLDVEASATTFVLRAAKTGFESKVIVEARNSSTTSVSAMPMNAETKAEADVFVEARSNAGAEAATVADVSLFVDSELAAAINSGNATAVDIAVALNKGRSAERAHAEEDPEGFDDDESRRQVEENRRDSFLDLQSQLSAATTASAQTAARNTFERSYASAFADAGINAEVQARAANSRKSAMIDAAVDANVSSEARFALTKRAEASVTLATSTAIQAMLRANGIAQARIDAIAVAGEALYAAIVTASSETQISAAYGDFSASVQAELAVAINVSPTVVAAARASADAAKVTLQTAINAAVDATDIASAYVAFFASAEASATAALSTSANASLGGEILALIAIY